MAKKSAAARARRAVCKKLAEQRLRDNGNLDHFEGTVARMTHNARTGPMIQVVNALNARANRPIRDRRRDRHPRHRGTSSTSYSGVDG